MLVFVSVGCADEDASTSLNTASSETGGGGGASASGSTASGGSASVAAGGSSAAILWGDGIQADESQWGFDGLAVQRPIGNDIGGSDAAGANLSRVDDPAGGDGFAMRHFATFDADGSRAQAGIWSFANSAFEAQAKSTEGVWVAQQWYFPEAIDAGGDEVPWINLWDWHSTGDGGADRWHTAPGLMLAEDGSMRVRWSWGDQWDLNPASGASNVAMPVGEWFDIEMHYRWSDEPTTLSLWINGELALELSDVVTRDPSHVNIETYSKFYGSDQGATPWSPTPSVKYTRNVRFAGSRIVD